MVGLDVSVILNGDAQSEIGLYPRLHQGGNELMLYLITMAEHIERMDALSIEEMRELCAVIGLDSFRSVTEISNGALDKIDGGIAAVFFVCNGS